MPATSGHADTGGLSAGRTQQVLFADKPGVHAVGCGGGAEESMEEGASESSGAARDSVQGPGATSGQSTQAAADNTRKGKKVAHCTPS